MMRESEVIMTNNDFLRRLRYALNLKDNVTVQIFKKGGLTVTKEKTDEKDLLFVAYKSDGYNVDINANSYLFQEGTGDKYENARYAKVVLVDNKLRLIDLRDKDFKEIK